LRNISKYIFYFPLYKLTIVVVVVSTGYFDCPTEEVAMTSNVPLPIEYNVLCG